MNCGVQRSFARSGKTKTVPLFATKLEFDFKTGKAVGFGAGMLLTLAAGTSM